MPPSGHLNDKAAVVQIAGEVSVAGLVEKEMP